MSIDFSTVTSVTIPEGDVVQIAIGGSTVWKRQPPAGYWEVTRSDGTAPTAGTMWVVRLSDGATGYYAFATETFTAVSFAVGDVVGHDDIMFSVDVSIASGHMSQYVYLNGGTYKCVNWGDGTVSAVATGALTVNHTYATAGTYTVKLYAIVASAISFYTGGYTDNRVCAINNDLPWSGLRDMSNCFQKCAFSSPITTDFTRNCTNLQIIQSAFRDCTGIDELPDDFLSHCSGITTIRAFMTGCSITRLPDHFLENFTAITTAYYAFRDCTALTYVPSTFLKGCSAVTDFSYAFMGCSAITSALPDLWNSHTSATKTACFRGCTQATNYADAQQAGWA